MRMSKRNKKKLVSLLIGLIVVTAGALSERYNIAIPGAQAVVQNQPGLYHVVEVFDGDTIAVDMNGTTEKIRMIGVDTPETHDPRKAVQCFGVAASNFTKGLLTDRYVRLGADSLSSNRDRYDRLLRYVYTSDNKLVEQELIQQGYGFAYIGFPFDKMDEFKAYQTEARQANRGLWGGCQPTDNNGQFRSNDAT